MMFSFYVSTIELLYAKPGTSSAHGMDVCAPATWTVLPAALQAKDTSSFLRMGVLEVWRARRTAYAPTLG